jgi:hypothetical protein
VAEPEDGGVSPVIIRIVVDLPAPFGTEEAGDRPRLGPEGDGVDGDVRAVALAEVLDEDHVVDPVPASPASASAAGLRRGLPR